MRSLLAALLLSACATGVPLTSEPGLRAEAYAMPAAVPQPALTWEAAKATGPLSFQPVATPNGYGHCLVDGQASSHAVAVGFDILPDGRLANVTVLSATDPCYAPAAARAVASRRFDPVLRDGVPHAVTGGVTTVRFEFSG